MKNIKNAANQKLMYIGLLCLSFATIQATVLPVQCVTTNLLNSSSHLTARDTFPFFKRQHNPTSLQEHQSTLFPDSKAYRNPIVCKVAFDGKDPATGERKKELYSEPLLSYTSPNIKPYVPGRDLLTAEGKLVKFSGGYTFLSIQFHFNAKNPQGTYGPLKANGAIRCQLTHDKSITLYNSKESLWQMDGDQTSHLLQTSFLLHPRQIKLLKKYPLMNLTVFWERGFEEYPIYPIEIFRNQLKCLE